MSDFTMEDFLTAYVTAMLDQAAWWDTRRDSYRLRAEGNIKGSKALWETAREMREAAQHSWAIAYGIAKHLGIDRRDAQDVAKEHGCYVRMPENIVLLYRTGELTPGDLTSHLIKQRNTRKAAR